MPPQPTYRERTSCSSAVACRCSASSVCSSRMASMFALNFVLAPPAPRSSSVIRKFIGSCLDCTGCSVSAPLSSGRLCCRRAWLTSSGVIGLLVRGFKTSSTAERWMASVRVCTSAISCICSGEKSGFSSSSNSPPDSATE